MVLVIPFNFLNNVEGVKDYLFFIIPIHALSFFILLYFIYSKVFFKFGIKNKIFIFKTKPLLTTILTIIIFFVTYFVLLLAFKINFNFDSNKLIDLLPGLQAPLFEELLFRGYLLHTFIETKCNKYLSLIIVSFIFGGLHMANYFFGMTITFTYILGIIAAGILLGSIYIRFGLGISIIVHYLWNNSNHLFLKHNDLENNISTHVVLIIISMLILFIDKSDITKILKMKR